MFKQFTYGLASSTERVLGQPAGLPPGNEDENVHARRLPGPEEAGPSFGELADVGTDDREGRAGVPAYRFTGPPAGGGEKVKSKSR